VDVSQGSTRKYTPGGRRCISADAFGGKKYVKGSEKARNTKEEELNKFKKGT
jgi:urease beta subunit